MAGAPVDNQFPDTNEVEFDDDHACLLATDPEAYKRWHFALPLPRRLAMDIRVFGSDALGFALTGDSSLGGCLENWLHRNDSLDYEVSPLPRDENPPDCDELLDKMRGYVESLEWAYRCGKKDIRCLLKELPTPSGGQWANEVAETLEKAYDDLRAMALLLTETIGARGDIPALQCRLVACRKKADRLSQTLEGFIRTLRSPSLEAAIGAMAGDPTSQALRQLGESEVWPIDDLPAGVDTNALRCLDRDGMIEVRLIIMQNMQTYRGDPSPPAPVKGDWFSPIAHPEQAGGWDQIMGKTLRDARNIPPEIRLTEAGKAKLGEQQAGKPAETAGKPGGEPAKPDPTDLIARSVAADLFGVAAKTLRAWIKNGDLPVYGADSLPSEAECREKVTGGILPKRRRQ